MNGSDVCVVTGASAGIGRAIAEAVLARGRSVVNLDYRMPDWGHPLMRSFQVDLSQEAQILACAQSVSKDYFVSALVNNAGVSRPGSIDSQTSQELSDMVGLHLRAPMLLIQQFLPMLRSSGRGRIVNISSRAAFGMRNRLAYSASKAGLIGMTHTLALELGRDGITVNAVAPGPIATELFRSIHPVGSASEETILNSIVVGRMGLPDDVAHAAAFFLAPEAGYVTGQVLNVCGGASL